VDWQRVWAVWLTSNKCGNPIREKRKKEKKVFKSGQIGLVCGLGVRGEGIKGLSKLLRREGAERGRDPRTWIGAAD
jgi:hypothetical protein